MDAIVTIHIGTQINKYVEASMKSAATRWGTELFIITDNPSQFHPAYVKLLVFDLVPADRILLLDSDTLITNNSPNPFELYSNLGVVDGAPKRLINYYGIKEHINRELSIFNENVNFYFNSGVMLINRKDHESCFDYARYLYRDDLEWHDQTPLNIALKSCQMDILDETWNFIPQTSNELDKFIYHFAGYENKNEHINFYAKKLDINCIN
jgi:lipopolysaccharide biosynthesis glycosyltransferase